MVGTYEKTFDPRDGQRAQRAVKIDDAKTSLEEGLRKSRPTDPFALFTPNKREHEAVDLPDGCGRDETD